MVSFRQARRWRALGVIFFASQGLLLLLAFLPDEGPVGPLTQLVVILAFLVLPLVAIVSLWILTRIVVNAMAPSPSERRALAEQGWWLGSIGWLMTIFELTKPALMQGERPSA